MWRRKVASRGRAMQRLGRKIPDTLVTITASRTVAPVLNQIGKMTAALRKNLARMGKKPQALLDEGVRLHAALSTADADQEVKRLSTLPAKVRDYYAAKGTLYVGLKVINDAGHELHAGDADAAGRYNLKILIPPRDQGGRQAVRQGRRRRKRPRERLRPFRSTRPKNPNDCACLAAPPPLRAPLARTSCALLNARPVRR